MFLRVAAVYEKKDDGYVLVNSAAHDENERKYCLNIFETETILNLENYKDGEICVDSVPEDEFVEEVTPSKFSLFSRTAQTKPSVPRAHYFIHAQYHAAYKNNDYEEKEHVCVFITNRKMYEKVNDEWQDLGEGQFRMILKNINLIYLYEDELSVNLKHIVKDTLNFIAREIKVPSIERAREEREAKVKASMSKIQQVKAQVDETKRVLVEEVIPKVTERGERLEQLEKDTVDLLASAEEFNRRAADVNKTRCCGVQVPDIVPNVPILNPKPN